MVDFWSAHHPFARPTNQSDNNTPRRLNLRRVLVREAHTHILSTRTTPILDLGRSFNCKERILPTRPVLFSYCLRPDCRAWNFAI